MVHFNYVGDQFSRLLKVVHRNNSDAPPWGFCKIVVEEWVYRLRVAARFQANGAGKRNIQILEVATFRFL
jgi:hypothetical protein